MQEHCDNCAQLGDELSDVRKLLRQERERSLELERRLGSERRSGLERDGLTPEQAALSEMEVAS